MHRFAHTGLMAVLVKSLLFAWRIILKVAHSVTLVIAHQLSLRSTLQYLEKTETYQLSHLRLAFV